MESAPTSAVSGKVLDWPLLKRILALAKPFRIPFSISIGLSLVLALISPIRPYLIQLTVDQDIVQNNFEGLKNMTLLLVALLILESFLRYFFSFITSWLGQSIIKRLRVSVFQHMIRLRLAFFDRTPIGTVTTRTINDVETINQIFSEGIITIVADILTILTVMGIMFYTDWKLTLVSLATFPILIYATYIFKEKIKASFITVRNQVAKLNAFLQEHISGMRIIQIFNAEAGELEKFKKINEQHRDAHIQSILYYSIFFPVVEVILASATGLMVWYGANQVIVGAASPGVLIAFILYLNMLFRPLRFLADKFNTLQMGLVAAERVFKVLDTQDHTQNIGNIHHQVQGDIRFDQVSFAYIAGRDVLKEISFHLPAGKSLAIVGQTGSGKSSLIHVLGRFYEHQKGNIFIDDIPIESYDLHALRQQMGVVLQDVFLFSGSVLENIRLRNPDITEDRIIEAAKSVGAHDFIMKLPGGYHFNVMERGATLSMGQRQLISFVRALVFQPRILILDEATSSVDSESELLIQDATARLITNRTSIIIAHRLSTIRNVDYIMVMLEGRVVEWGNHHSLMEQNGYYAQLNRSSENDSLNKDIYRVPEGFNPQNA